MRTHIWRKHATRTLYYFTCVRFRFSSPACYRDWFVLQFRSSASGCEPASFEDIQQLAELLSALFTQEADFRPDPAKQAHGLRLIIEQPHVGRIFVARDSGDLVGMVNLLFTVSTAEGWLLVALKDLVVRPVH